MIGTFDPKAVDLMNSVTNPKTGYRFFDGDIMESLRRAERLMNAKEDGTLSTLPDSEHLNAIADFLDTLDLEEFRTDETDMQEFLRWSRSPSKRE